MCIISKKFGSEKFNFTVPQAQSLRILLCPPSPRFSLCPGATLQEDIMKPKVGDIWLVDCGDIEGGGYDWGKCLVEVTDVLTDLFFMGVVVDHGNRSYDFSRGKDRVPNFMFYDNKLGEIFGFQEEWIFENNMLIERVEER